MSDTRKDLETNKTIRLAGSPVAGAYDRWSVQYDTDRNPTRDLDAVTLRQNALVEFSGRSVLEIGCGTGKNTEWLAQHATELVALDFSPGMLAAAARRVQRTNVRFVQHDLHEPWPIADASMDIVIGNLVLEHIEQLDGVYGEASRVLRDGGQLYFCELHPFRQWRGVQAHFTEQSTGDSVHVSAFVHSVSDYINPALRNGFVLMQLGEWVEDDAPANALPRLLSVLFTRATRS